MRIKNILFIMLLFFTVACSGRKPFQPPPHPAELWAKTGYTFHDVLRELKACGWVEPEKNVNPAGKINMDVYAKAELCMREKGFIYTGRTPLICERRQHKDLPVCKNVLPTKIK